MSDDLAEMAGRALACLDLTNLDEDCDAEAVSKLCRRAVTAHGSVAAVCVWPRFVAQARKELAPDVKVATVVNFPTGEETAETVNDMTEQAIRDGADEIDMVIPYRSLMEGSPEKVLARVERVRRAAFDAPVKAILETGVLATPEMIRLASELAIEGGARFLKTSTGKVPINATLTSAQIMLEAIRDKDPTVGFKASGGVRTTQDAANYIGLADEILGEGWAIPARFRIGASGVLDALLETLDGGDAAKPAGAGR